MGPLTNELLGILFVALAVASTFLMFHLWGFPFDKQKLKSEAPRPLMLTHRVLGYLYLVIYVYLMIQMVPRLWTYQVELPARTVVHLLLGMAIGRIGCFLNGCCYGGACELPWAVTFPPEAHRT